MEELRNVQALVDDYYDNLEFHPEFDRRQARQEVTRMDIIPPDDSSIADLEGANVDCSSRRRTPQELYNNERLDQRSLVNSDGSASNIGDTKTSLAHKRMRQVTVLPLPLDHIRHRDSPAELKPSGIQVMPSSRTTDTEVNDNKSQICVRRSIP